MNEHEFFDLLRQQSGKLLRVAWAMVGQEADAWDALQEASVAAFQARYEFRGGAPAFPAWMKRIVINQCLRVLRSRSRVVTLAPEAMPEPPPVPSLERHIDGIVLWEAVQALDPTHREVVSLRYLADLSVDDIADTLQIPVGTAKSRLHRALEELRQAVSGYERRGGIVR